MGKKYNEAFLNTFLELDKLCCMKFGIKTGGVTEYINRLNNARFAPGRDEVLPKLVRYRNLRNCFAHEPGAIRRKDDVAKEDIKWVAHFRKDMLKKRDPISKYLRKARKYALHKKLKRGLLIALPIVAVIVAVVLFIVLK